jgi:hypothetical protein
MFEDTRRYVQKLGLPAGDLNDLPTSDARFPDGAAYRIEVPTVNSAEAVGALLDASDKLGITINRVTETYGMFRHTRQELKEYCRPRMTPARPCCPHKECASATVYAVWSRCFGRWRTSSGALISVAAAS